MDREYGTTDENLDEGLLATERNVDRGYAEKKQAEKLGEIRGGGGGCEPRRRKPHDKKTGGKVAHTWPTNREKRCASSTGKP